MSKMIQIRNVPDALHRGLKDRAAMAGMSLSDYLLMEIKEIAEKPTHWQDCESAYTAANRFQSRSTQLACYAKSARHDDRAGCFGHS
ncbi:MAG TPA: hypothetical protein VF493_00580 [Terriglobales bacterium]